MNKGQKAKLKRKRKQLPLTEPMTEKRLAAWRLKQGKGPRKQSKNYLENNRPTGQKEGT